MQRAFVTVLRNVDCKLRPCEAFKQHKTSQIPNHLAAVLSGRNHRDRNMVTLSTQTELGHAITVPCFYEQPTPNPVESIRKPSENTDHGNKEN